MDKIISIYNIIIVIYGIYLYESFKKNVFSNFSRFYYITNNNLDKIITIPKIYNINEIEQVIFGSLLGDGHLEKQTRNVNVRFCLTQSESNYEYFIHLWGIITQVSPCSYNSYSYSDKRTKKIYVQYTLKTRVNSIYTKYYSFFYLNKKKIVPENLNLLTPLALAHWISQDGTKSTTGGFYFCTDNFDKMECIRISNYLNDKYKFNSSLHNTSKGRWRIYIKSKSFVDLRNLVLPYMHESMLYKITL
jgi:LAGLIDADG DNA endonuclease family